MKYELVVFDMDGTILDTLDDLYTSINFALKNNSLPARSKEEIRKFLGNGLMHLAISSVPAGTEQKEVDNVCADFSAHYKKHCADKTKPYEGILALLAALRAANIRTAVVSNKPDFGVQELVNRYFHGLFDYAVGERAGIRRKPAPDTVNSVMKHLHIGAENTIYVGDSEVDLQTTKNSGISCCIVSWGFRDKSYLAACGAEEIVSDIEELRAKLLQI